MLLAVRSTGDFNLPRLGGEITQFGRNYGVLHQSQHPFPGFTAPLSRPWSLSGGFFLSGACFAPDLAPAGGGNMFRCILDRGTVSALRLSDPESSTLADPYTFLLRR